MSRLSDGISRVLLQVTVTFLVVGTAYLLVFNPGSDPIGRQTPEQVGKNIAPIGRVSLATPPPVAAAPPPVATETPSPVATETPSADSPAASAVARPIEAAAEPIAESEADRPEPIAEPATQQPETDRPESVAASTASASEPAAAPAAAIETTSNPRRVPGPTAGFELKPDALGMHGIYQRTPRGIMLYPRGLAPTTMSMEAVNGLTGTLRLTPSGEIYFQIISDTAEQPSLDQ